MNSYACAISLRIKHPSFDPAELSNLLGRAPDNSWRAGEARVNLRGRPLGGTRDSSYWIARLIDGSDAKATLAAVLAGLVRSLAHHEELFNSTPCRGRAG